MDYPVWYIENKTLEITRINTEDEDKIFLNKNFEKLFTVCHSKPTKEDIDYYVYGITKEI